MIIPNIWENKTNVPSHQPDLVGSTPTKPPTHTYSYYASRLRLLPSPVYPLPPVVPCQPPWPHPHLGGFSQGGDDEITIYSNYGDYR